MNTDGVLRFKTIYLILVVLALFFYCIRSHAAHIKCYSGGKQIYKGEVYDVTFYKDIFSFIDKAKNKTVFIYANCIVDIPVSEIEEDMYAV